MKRKQTELTVEVPLQGQNKSNFLFEIFFSNWKFIIFNGGFSITLKSDTCNAIKTMKDITRIQHLEVFFIV